VIDLPRLYLITDRKATANQRSIVDVIGEALSAIPNGAAIVQMREKDLEGKDALSLAKQLREVTRKFACPLLINDRIDIALAADADGVQLPQDSFDVQTARQLLGPDQLIGCSTHSPTEAQAAANAGADFVVYGPIWSTPSKQTFGPPLGPESLPLAAKARSPIFAIGGVTPQTAPTARNSGAYGVAAIRTVVAAADPAAAAEQLFASIQD